MKAFSIIRHGDPAKSYETGHLLDGVVFEDGTTVIRWRTVSGSTSIFKSFDDFDKIHGNQAHPEYNSEFVWYLVTDPNKQTGGRG